MRDDIDAVPNTMGVVSHSLMKVVGPHVIPGSWRRITVREHLRAFLHVPIQSLRVLQPKRRSRSHFSAEAVTSHGQTRNILERGQVVDKACACTGDVRTWLQVS